MDFIPQANWQWQFDAAAGKLTVQFGDGAVELVYHASMLAIDVHKIYSFTLEDLANYTALLEKIVPLAFPEIINRNIILHTLAIELFHKPIMPKSWLFIDSDTADASLLAVNEKVCLTSKGSLQQANYLLVENYESFSLCMLLDEQHQLTDSRCFQQFQIVKVTHDKISPNNEKSATPWHSYQIA